MSFLRFQTPLRCANSGLRAGVFTAAGQLEDAANLSESTQNWLANALRWFNQNLRAPTDREVSWRAMFWLRADATEFVSRMWDLVWILRDEGVSVEMLRTLQPGEIVYSDAHQIAAIPERPRRHRR
jgi:hypothetical protein